MMCPDLAHEARKIADAEESRAMDAEVADLARVTCEEYYTETQYGMDPEYDSPDFGDLSPEDVSMLNSALSLTSKLMALPTKDAESVLETAHATVDSLDDIPF